MKLKYMPALLMPLATVNNWIASLKRGQSSSKDAQRLERLISVSTPENIDLANDMVLSDGRSGVKYVSALLMPPAMVKIWIASLNRGKFFIQNDQRPERPSSLSTPENIDAAHDMML